MTKTVRDMILATQSEAGLAFGYANLAAGKVASASAKEIDQSCDLTPELADLWHD